MGYNTDADYRHALAVLTRLDDVVVDAVREATLESALGGMPCSTLRTCLKEATGVGMDPVAFESFIAGIVRSGRLQHDPETHFLRAVPQ